MTGWELERRYRCGSPARRMSSALTMCTFSMLSSCLLLVVLQRCQQTERLALARNEFQQLLCSRIIAGVGRVEPLDLLHLHMDQLGQLQRIGRFGVAPLVVVALDECELLSVRSLVHQADLFDVQLCQLHSVLPYPTM